MHLKLISKTELLFSSKSAYPPVFTISQEDCSIIQLHRQKSLYSYLILLFPLYSKYFKLLKCRRFFRIDPESKQFSSPPCPLSWDVGPSHLYPMLVTHVHNFSLTLFMSIFMTVLYSYFGQCPLIDFHLSLFFL